MSALLVGVCSIVAVLAFALLTRESLRARRPKRLLREGRYAQAREAARQVSESWLSRLSPVRNAARYAIASCLHLQGDLDASLRTLSALPTAGLGRQLRYARLSLEAANLVLDGRDLPRAEVALREARAIQETPEDLLFHAHALLGLDRRSEALALFHRAAGARPRRPNALETTAFHFLRGFFLVRTGERARAIADLQAAAAGPHENVYVIRARALLAPTAAGDVDPRSSLAPQVIERPVETKGDPPPRS